MFKVFKNGNVYLGDQFEKTDFLVAGSKIVKIGPVDSQDVRALGVETETVDCTGMYVLPGLIDSQICMVGGSGESGFLSQPPRITIDECIRGGITTTVGAIGVDTLTKTMANLFSCVRAFRDAGLSSYAYSGGYEIPPRTLTGDLRQDIYFVDEIIGAGEISIADRRAPEPAVDALARVVIDAYTSGLMTGKAGVTRLHVGEGKKRLSTAFQIMEDHEIIPESLYFTHMERSKELLKEGITAAKKGCYVDFDIQERDLEVWYKLYREHGGRPDRLSFSTDAGAISPAELWLEIRKCVLEHKLPLEETLRHVTTVPAEALKLKAKGRIEVGYDADIVVTTQSDLEIRHVLANGRFFMYDRDFKYCDQPYTSRRKLDWYGIRNEVGIGS